MPKAVHPSDDRQLTFRFVAQRLLLISLTLTALALSGRRDGSATVILCPLSGGLFFLPLRESEMMDHMHTLTHWTD